jgi:DNA-binding response OmpR family regulator
MDEVKSKKILVVDDVASMRLLVVGVLEADGYQVTEASSSEEMSKILEADGQFHLIFLDINMPGESGIDAMDRLSKSFKTVRPKVCFISGDRDREVVLRALNSGGSDYIIKPIDPKLLRRKVKALLFEPGSPQAPTLVVDLFMVFPGLPIDSRSRMVKLGERGFKMISDLRFKTGRQFECLVPGLADVLEPPKAFLAKVVSASGSSPKFRYTCQFIGMEEGISKAIRGIIVSGEPRSDRK